MITLRFLRTWFRWLLGSCATLLMEWSIVHVWLWRIGIGVAILIAFCAVSAILYGDWKCIRRGMAHGWLIAEGRDY